MRDEPLVSSCTNYATTPAARLLANFAAGHRRGAASARGRATAASARASGHAIASSPQARADGLEQTRRRRRCRGFSPTWWGAGDEAAAAATRVLAGNPVLIGALTVLVTIVAVDARLQRHQRAAVRARPTRCTCRRPTPRSSPTATTSTWAARWSASSPPSRRRAPATGTPIALINLQLDRKHQAAAGRHALHDPPQGRDRAEVPADHARALRRGDSPTARPCRWPDEQRGRLRPGAVDVQPAHPHGRAATRRSASARRWPDAGTTSTRRSARSCRCCATCSRWRANLASPHDQPGGVLPRAGELLRRRWRRSPRPQAPLFVEPRHDVPRAGRRSPFPSLQSTISATPPIFEATISDSPMIRAVPHRHRRAVARAAPGLRHAAAERAGARRRVPDRDAQPAATAALDQQTVPLSQTLASYSQTPSVQQGLDRLTLTPSTASSRRSRSSRRSSRTCNYVTLFLRNTAEPARPSTSARAGCCASCRSRSTTSPGVESEPSSKPFTGGSTTDSGPLHVNPYPYTDSPGQPAECSAGNEPLSASTRCDRQPARQRRRQDREDDAERLK